MINIHGKVAVFGWCAIFGCTCAVFIGPEAFAGNSPSKQVGVSYKSWKFIHAELLSSDCSNEYKCNKTIGQTSNILKV